jgi:hypothetical protein
MRSPTLLLAVGLALSGCNAITGGPGSSDIEAVARAQLIAAAPNARIAEAARNAELSPRGICNHTGELYACMVDVRANGTEQTFVVEIKKDTQGNWVAAR